jgi:hypothetical protein
VFSFAPQKSQPNGSVVAELQEEVRVTEEDNLPVVPHHSQVNTEKASEVGLMLLVGANSCMQA